MDELTLDGVRQFYVALEQEVWKFDTLVDIITRWNPQFVVFCNTVDKVEWLVEQLLAKDIKASTFYFDTDEDTRKKKWEEYYDMKITIFVTNHFHCQAITRSRIINYDMPSNCEEYLQRVGSSCRFGKKGLVINFLTKENVPLLKEIERVYETYISEMPENLLD
jgi:superfamily II DNA/RNA helicase